MAFSVFDDLPAPTTPRRARKQERTSSRRTGMDVDDLHPGPAPYSDLQNHLHDGHSVSYENLYDPEGWHDNEHQVNDDVVGHTHPIAEPAADMPVAASRKQAATADEQGERGYDPDAEDRNSLRGDHMNGEHEDTPHEGCPMCNKPVGSDIKESSVNREAQILEAMSKASYHEGLALAQELEGLRARERAGVAADREVGLGRATLAHRFASKAPHEFHTAATDWLGDLTFTGASEDPPETYNEESEKNASHCDICGFSHPGGQEAHYKDSSLRQRMATEASLWFESVHPAVKADREEFAIQAMGAARRTSGRYGERATEAYQAFLAKVAEAARPENVGNQDLGPSAEMGDAKLDWPDPDGLTVGPVTTGETPKPSSEAPVISENEGGSVSGQTNQGQPEDHRASLRRRGQGFGHDPEVPAGYQDADIEQAQLEDAGNRRRTYPDHLHYAPFDDSTEVWPHLTDPGPDGHGLSDDDVASVWSAKDLHRDEHGGREARLRRRADIWDDAAAYTRQKNGPGPVTRGGPAPVDTTTQDDPSSEDAPNVKDNSSGPEGQTNQGQPTDHSASWSRASAWRRTAEETRPPYSQEGRPNQPWTEKALQGVTDRANDQNRRTQVEDEAEPQTAAPAGPEPVVKDDEAHSNNSDTTALPGATSARQAADDGSIYCKRCGGQGMVRAGGVVRNCTTCKGSGLKPKMRNNPDVKDTMHDYASRHQAELEDQKVEGETHDGGNEAPKTEENSASAWGDQFKPEVDPIYDNEQKVSAREAIWTSMGDRVPAIQRAAAAQLRHLAESPVVDNPEARSQNQDGEPLPGNDTEGQPILPGPPGAGPDMDIAEGGGPSKEGRFRAVAEVGNVDSDIHRHLQQYKHGEDVDGLDFTQVAEPTKLHNLLHDHPVGGGWAGPDHDHYRPEDSRREYSRRTAEDYKRTDAEREEDRHQSGEAQSAGVGRSPVDHPEVFQNLEDTPQAQKVDSNTNPVIQENTSGPQGQTNQGQPADHSARFRRQGGDMVDVLDMNKSDVPSYKCAKCGKTTKTSSDISKCPYCGGSDMTKTSAETWPWERPGEVPDPFVRDFAQQNQEPFIPDDEWIDPPDGAADVADVPVPDGMKNAAAARYARRAAAARWTGLDDSQRIRGWRTGADSGPKQHDQSGQADPGTPVGVTPEEAPETMYPWQDEEPRGQDAADVADVPTPGKEVADYPQPRQGQRREADSMFPGAGAQVYRNEAGEPLGWDYPSDPSEDPGDPYDGYGGGDDAYDSEYGEGQAAAEYDKSVGRGQQSLEGESDAFREGYLDEFSASRRQGAYTDADGPAGTGASNPFTPGGAGGVPGGAPGAPGGSGGSPGTSQDTGYDPNSATTPGTPPPGQAPPGGAGGASGMPNAMPSAPRTSWRRQADAFTMEEGQIHQDPAFSDGNDTGRRGGPAPYNDADPKGAYHDGDNPAEAPNPRNIDQTRDPDDPNKRTESIEHQGRRNDPMRSAAFRARVKAGR